MLRAYGLQFPTSLWQTLDIPAISYNEASFRLALNEDQMATEKLSEGIRAFCADTVKLEKLILAEL